MARRRRRRCSRSARQGRRRVGGAEQHAPGRRLARDRDHGRDRRCVRDARRANPAALRGRLPPRAAGRRGRSTLLGARRRGADAQRRPQRASPSGRRRSPKGDVAPRLPAEERRAAVLDTACRVFSAARTAARRPPRSPARPASPSRSSIATSPRSRRCTSRASTTPGQRVRAGVGRGGRSRARPARVDAGDVDRVLPVQGAALGGGDALAARAHRVRRRPGDPQVPAAAPARGARVRRRRPDALPGGGGGAAERDPRAEAWIFVAVGLLVAVAGRLGGLPAGELERIRASRRAWLTALGPGIEAPARGPAYKAESPGCGSRGSSLIRTTAATHLVVLCGGGSRSDRTIAPVSEFVK